MRKSSIGEPYATQNLIFCAYYNFCEIHQSLRVTPAMEAGISDRVWSIEELVAPIGKSHRTRDRSLDPRRDLGRLSQRPACDLMCCIRAWSLCFIIRNHPNAIRDLGVHARGHAKRAVDAA